ncbi:Multidrug resistance protein stp [Roseovarius sp. THAF27]|uniref:DHA2 family efflux MFS transporter permease subunit n=1 Tax=Roseovarius sp. THAF27 TaxID=2587850 RepID=UPI00126836BD|nr:DHA2 family efflux MFS transporter permease subunit [Roseovarius sp. THAF27]QFT81976.1 Multidrug resistance protein stp [Roseovarius sp. THAF27]
MTDLTMTRTPSLPPAVAVAALGASSFMITLDATALHVALPTIAEDLGASLTALQWIASAYTLVFAGLLLSSGALSDRMGARTVFLWALMFFVGASALCGLAPSTEILIAARAIQGIGAAAILPSSMALLVDAFPDPRARARALGSWSAISAIALVAGPLLGGFLAGTLGWRAIFLLNLPVGLLAFAAAAASVGNPERQDRALDPVGQVLGIIALAALVFAATEGRELGWGSGFVVAALAVGTFAACGFVIAERHHGDPMLPPALFRSRAFTGAILGAFLYNFAYYGALFALSITLQTDGAVPIEVGLKFAPMTATTAIVAFALGRIVARFGAERPAMVTLTAGAVGAAILMIGGLEALPFFAGSLLIGIGGATLPAIVSATLENVATGRTGVGSAVLNTSRQAGGAFGVAILGALIGASSITAALIMIAGSFLLGAAALWWCRRQ